MEQKRMTDEAFAQMKRQFKLPAVDLLLVSPAKDLLLVKPREGAAAGKWAFPGTLARNGPSMRRLALQHANEAFGWGLELLDVRYFSRDERTWHQDTDASAQYLVDITEVRVPREFRDVSRIVLLDKYSEVAWFSQSEIASSEECHRFVGEHFQQWINTYMHRTLDW